MKTFVCMPSRSFLLRIRNVSDRSCTKYQNTHFVFSNIFFFDKRPIYEKMWKKYGRAGHANMTKWRMRIACWIPKATNTHSEYVILIAFPVRQWSHESASCYPIRTLAVSF